jgi:hypothetical protein
VTAPGLDPARRLLAWLLLLGGIAALAAGLVGWRSLAAATPDRGVVPAVARAAAPAPAAAAGPETPVALQLPSSDIATPVVPVAVNVDNSLDVPENPNVLGWWRDGARPGSDQGTVVIDGHVDSARDGRGALFHLRELRPGDQVRLHTDQGAHDYVVRALRSYPKATLPPELFATDGLPRLVLITCGGAFDTRTSSYADNVVAYAVPA